MVGLSRETKMAMLEACDDGRIRSIGREIERVFRDLNVTTLEAFVILEALSFGVVEGSQELQKIIYEDHAARLEVVLAKAVGLHVMTTPPKRDPDEAA